MTFCSVQFNSLLLLLQHFFGVSSYIIFVLNEPVNPCKAPASGSCCFKGHSEYCGIGGTISKAEGLHSCSGGCYVLPLLCPSPHLGLDPDTGGTNWHCRFGAVPVVGGDSSPGAVQPAPIATVASVPKPTIGNESLSLLSAARSSASARNLAGGFKPAVPQTLPLALPSLPRKMETGDEGTFLRCIQLCPLPDYHHDIVLTCKSWLLTMKKKHRKNRMHAPARSEAESA